MYHRCTSTFAVHSSTLYVSISERTHMHLWRKKISLHNSNFNGDIRELAKIIRESRCLVAAAPRLCILARTSDTKQCTEE